MSRRRLLLGYETPPPPEIVDAVVQNASPYDFVITLDSSCTGTTAGWTPKINGGAATKTGFSGSGTAIFTITVSDTIQSTDTLTIDYDDVSGDTQSVSTGVDLESETAYPVTNNIAAGTEDVSINNPKVAIYGNTARVTWQVSTNGSLPGLWTIERKIGGGNWATLTTTYSYTWPGSKTGFTWNQWYPYIFYEDVTVVPGNSYTYRISGGDSAATETNTASSIGTTYYVSSSTGNDSNNGTSSSSPWETLAKANGNRLPGDYVLFKRGDTWNSAATASLSGKGSGTEENPIVWGAYGGGNDPILNITTSTGLDMYNVSHWYMDYLDFRGTTKWPIRMISTSGNTVEGLKILRCVLDYSNISGWSAGMFATEADATNSKTSTSTTRNLEVGFCEVKAPNVSGAYRSAVKPFSVTENFVCHNTFLNEVPAGFDVAGGDDMRMEFCKTKFSNYGGATEPESSKWHSQQRFVERPIARYNLIYGSEAYGLAFETTRYGIMENNTIYMDNYGYGGMNDTPIWDTPEFPHEGNFYTRNIAYGSRAGGGAKLIATADVNDNGEQLYGCPPDEYWKMSYSKDNCYYKTLGDYVFITDSLGPNRHIDTGTEWTNDWLPYASGDINTDPLFTNPGTEDFSLQGGSPCPTWGAVNILPSTDLNLLYAAVNDSKRNTIVFLFDKDLDETYTDTTAFSCSPSKTCTTVTVKKYVVEAEFNSDFSDTDSITATYTAGATKIKHFNLIAANFAGISVRNNIFTGVTKQLLQNSSFLDGWTGDDPDGWVVPSQDGANYVNYHHELDANGYTTYTGARLASSSTTMYMSQNVLTNGNDFDIGISIAKVNSGGITIKGGLSDVDLNTTGVHYFSITANTTTFRIENQLAASDVIIRWASVRDTSPPAQNPVFVSGEVGLINDTTLEVTFDQVLASGYTSGTHDMTASGGAVTLSSPTIVNGKLRATTSRAITYGETLTYAYTNGGATPLQNGSAYEVQTFGAQSITNNVQDTSLGPELVTNGDFSLWSAGAPTGWTEVGDNGSTNTITEDNGTAKFDVNDIGQVWLRQDILTIGDQYRVTCDISSYISGTAGFGGFVEPAPLNANGSYSYDLTANEVYFLVARDYRPHMNVDNVSVKKITQGAPSTPTITSVTVENTNPYNFVVTLSEACTGTTAGWTPKIGGVAATKTNFSGSGITVFTITISETILSTDTLTIDYDDVTGDTTSVSDSVDLATDTGVSVTNNVDPTGGRIGILNVNPGFEDGTFINEYKISTQNNNDAVIEVLTTPPIRSGTYSTHFFHQYTTGSTHNRCEVIPDTDFGGYTTGAVPWYQEWWLGLSVYLKDFADYLGNATPPDTSGWNTIWQMHGVPSINPATGNPWWQSGGEGYLSPPNSFTLQGGDGFFGYSEVGEPYIGLHYKTYADPYGTWDYQIYPIPPWWIPVANGEDTWIDFVFNFRISPGPHATINPGVPDGFLSTDRLLQSEQQYQPDRFLLRRDKMGRQHI
jgi:hypothetical protein